jgi:rhodanese-related sulfurtransferase
MKKLLLTIMLGAIALTGASAHATEVHPYTVITAETLQKMQAENAELAVFDARGGKYFDGTMIKGAKNLPTGETTAENLAKHVKAKTDAIVFYCTNTSCPASELSAYKANAAGYTNIYKYKAGIEDWVAKGLPTNK